jgi:hypothetical protein
VTIVLDGRRLFLVQLALALSKHSDVEHCLGAPPDRNDFHRADDGDVKRRTDGEDMMATHRSAPCRR